MFGTSSDSKISMYKQETTGLKLFPILAPKICLKYRSPKTKRLLIRQNFLRFIEEPIGTWNISSLKWVEKNSKKWSIGIFVKRLTTSKLISWWLKGLFIDSKFMKWELFFYMDVRNSAKQRRELFCKPFDQIGHNKATEGYNWLLMNLGVSNTT